MGLDMYLTARRSFWKHQGPAAEKAIAALNRNKAFRLPGADGNGYDGPGAAVRGVEVLACYWRKANHIHNWFVKNVQAGVDECEPHDVSTEQLTALRDACRAVLADREKAPELLPTGSGFFFGSTDYDEYYFEDCERTEKVLSAILTNPPGDLLNWDFEYRSSW